MTDEDFKAGEEKGLVLGELKLIRQEISGIRDSFCEFKAGIGQRMEKLTENETMCKLNVVTELAKIKEEQTTTIQNMKDLADSKNWIIKIVIGAFVGALIALVIKK